MSDKPILYPSDLIRIARERDQRCAPIHATTILFPTDEICLDRGGNIEWVPVYELADVAAFAGRPTCEVTVRPGTHFRRPYAFHYREPGDAVSGAWMEWDGEGFAFLHDREPRSTVPVFRVTDTSTFPFIALGGQVSEYQLAGAATAVQPSKRAPEDESLAAWTAKRGSAAADPELAIVEASPGQLRDIPGELAQVGDRAYVLMETVERSLINHPVLREYPRLQVLAGSAHRRLWQLYQEAFNGPTQVPAPRSPAAE